MLASADSQAGDWRLLAMHLNGTHIELMTVREEKSFSDAVRDLSALIDAARATREPVWISHGKRRVAAVIGAEQLERLQELADDMADILDAETARNEM
jgi:prevent-host-death family protein